MQPYILNLQGICPVVHETFVHENCHIFFTFFFFAPFYKSNFEPTTDTLLVDRFVLYVAYP